MNDIHPGWYLAGIVAVIIVWSNVRLRAMLILGVMLFLLIAAGRSLVRTTTCAPGETVELQPTWAGLCWPHNGGAVLKAPIP